MSENEYSEVLDDLERIWDELWEIDIPSPTIPEYIEHHEQVQSVMKVVRAIEDKWVALYKQEYER